MFIHNACNFSCSYCSDYHRNGSLRWPQDWTPYLELIKKQKKRTKYVHIEILGGEPTLWPKFYEFIEAVSDENVFVEWGTNGSRTLRYWEQLKPQRAFVSFSWHSEYADDEHFYRAVEIMQDKASINCSLMVLPTNFDRAVALYESLKNLNVEVAVLEAKKAELEDFIEVFDDTYGAFGALGKNGERRLIVYGDKAHLDHIHVQLDRRFTLP
jgi:organic radical activating enzyme